MENEQDFNWTEESIIGLALLNAGHDSQGKPIDPNVFYRVGKHKENGMLAILATEKNQVHEFANSILKKRNKFN